MLDFGEAHTLAELLEAAHVAEKKLGEQVWFRGHAKNDWKLVPSAHRRHPALEAQFAHHFRLRAPSLAANCPELCIPRKLDTHSTANWTVIPRQTGQSERSDAGLMGCTPRRLLGSSF